MYNRSGATKKKFQGEDYINTIYYIVRCTDVKEYCDL